VFRRTPSISPAPPIPPHRGQVRCSVIPWGFEDGRESRFTEELAGASIRLRCCGRCSGLAADDAPQDAAIRADRVLRPSIQHQELMPTVSWIRMNGDEDDVALANDLKPMRLQCGPARLPLGRRRNEVIGRNHQGAKHDPIDCVGLALLAHNHRGAPVKIGEHDGWVLMNGRSGGGLSPHATQKDHQHQQGDASHGAPMSVKSGQEASTSCNV